MPIENLSLFLLILSNHSFCFDGSKNTPSTEDDTPAPLSQYSKAKAEREKLVLEAYDCSFVVRILWGFGIANNNFINRL